MLRFLRLREFALVESLELELAPGLCLLTGETGAGKSILVEAVGLVTGRRAESEMVRSGAEEATVEALFEVQENPVHELLASWGVAAAGEVVVRRRLSRAGRSAATVNGDAVSLGQLKTLGALLVEIHGQHQGQALLEEESHRRLLDSLEEVAGPAARTAEAHAALAEDLAALRDLQRSAAERERRLDAVRFQREEIDRVGPRAGEEEELRAVRSRLQHAGALAENAGAVAEALGDPEEGAAAALAGARKRIGELARFDPGWEAYGRDLDQAASILATIAAEAARTAATATFDPQALERAEERLAGLERLRRKYGPTLDEVLALRESLEAEHRRLTGRGAGEEEVRRRVEAGFARWREAARTLGEARRLAARSLAEAVERELRPLALDKARFAVELKPLTAEGPEAARPTGLEEVAFAFSANPGEPLKPLARIASGGELSRTMLALLTASRLAGGPATVIFDEVDAGIGGSPAEAVGRRLAMLSAARQVLCITHLPQIAAFADRHIRVEKRSAGGRTTVRAAALPDAERVEELARMVAGAKVTATARDHARALLSAARGKG